MCGCMFEWAFSRRSCLFDSGTLPANLYDVQLRFNCLGVESDGKHLSTGSYAFASLVGVIQIVISEPSKLCLFCPAGQ